MTSKNSEKNKNKPLSEHVRRAMKRYFEDLNNADPANIYEMVMAEVEPELFKAVMRFTENNQSKAAALLGLNRATLRKKLQGYKILEKS